MKQINDTSYMKMKEMQKYKDLFDFSSLECRVAIVGMAIIDAIFIICSLCIGVDATVEKCIDVVDNIGIAFIGFLGFTVSALAVLTGAISSKVVKMLQDRDKMRTLERILLSFYLMGLVCALEILAVFVLHILVQLPINSILVINVIFASIVSYLTVFVIFYSVKLIGNCLELFYIVNNMDLLEYKSIDFKARYNNYRIAALEKKLLSDSSVEKVQEYKETIKKLIENDNISEEETKILMKMFNEHFGN